MAEEMVMELDDRTLYMYVPNEPDFEAAIYLSTYTNPDGSEIPSVHVDSLLDSHGGGHVQPDDGQTTEQAVADTVKISMGSFSTATWFKSMEDKYGKKD